MIQPVLERLRVGIAFCEQNSIVPGAVSLATYVNLTRIEVDGPTFVRLFAGLRVQKHRGSGYWAALKCRQDFG